MTGESTRKVSMTLFQKLVLTFDKVQVEPSPDHPEYFSEVHLYEYPHNLEAQHRLRFHVAQKTTSTTWSLIYHNANGLLRKRDLKFIKGRNAPVRNEKILDFYSKAKADYQKDYPAIIEVLEQSELRKKQEQELQERLDRIAPDAEGIEARLSRGRLCIEIDTSHGDLLDRVLAILEQEV
ncbi:hypothetical protein [Pseudobacteriovorax antillogorgiicola]|uniref:Uncharacterized protein n=1 Tax=Pseudobacteriovorax antillogorgiicola TaxID=1513793 RepID=A0A1Y6BSG3_9BACT|nr:hypothetical protein [Pseudobacteriovorax antillogorgiicola]TCS53012.1 hypothetical protein EDD56_10863 [Pseudobacteriovorax antillogorgiicola]SMF26956.1 hypothetical protein SAMN06296036_108184 [Pseudobacteriovorax antillogorgiicola]